MRRATLIASAAVLDWVVGDPEWLPHPVRLMGAGIKRGERMLWREEASPAVQFTAGAGLTVALCGAAWVLSDLAIRWAGPLRPVVEVWLAATCLASRNLDEEAVAVLGRLAAGQLPEARGRLARIVGRDTAALEEAGICRAVIETLAESSCDGVAAPLFFLALGGVPAAMAFKAVSTLDSMIGHRTPRYLYFGRCAARLDDLANYLPARLTALALLVQRPEQRAVGVWLRDHAQHASPNAGHPEAAMAGVLQVQLGGASAYEGEAHEAPLLGAGLPLPRLAKARRALMFTRTTAVLLTVAAVVSVAWLGRRRA